MKKAGLLILFGVWLMVSPIVFYAEDDSFCQNVYERCVNEAYTQDGGWIKTALALEQCDLLYYQCLFINNFFPWLLLFLPYVR